MALVDVTRAQQAGSLASVASGTISVLASAATAAIERYCHREFASASRTETYDGDGTDELILRGFPVVSIDAVTITDDDGTEYDVDTDDLDFNANTGLLFFAPDAEGDWDYWPKGRQNIEVEYTAGFSGVPADVQEACVELMAVMYSQASRDPTLTSERLGDWQASYGTYLDQQGLPGNVVRLLAPYVDHRV